MSAHMRTRGAPFNSAEFTRYRPGFTPQVQSVIIATNNGLPPNCVRISTHSPNRPFVVYAGFFHKFCGQIAAQLEPLVYTHI